MSRSAPTFEVTTMSDDTDDIDAVIGREEDFYAALTASDVDKLDAIISDGLQAFVHSTGVVDSKADYLARVKTGRYAHGRITRLGGETRLFGDAAVTIGMIDLAARSPGTPHVTMRLQQVLVWAREPAGWRLVQRQATRMPL